MQNNMEYVQAIYGAKGRHVEHDILTCVLQHLVAVN